MSITDPTAQILDGITYPTNSCITNLVWCISISNDSVCPPCDGVTPTMLDFLNLTSSVDNYVQAYCLNPPDDDSCLFGLCPNSDVAGPLIRISAYAANICTALLVFYSPDDAVTSFWSQVLSGFSLLVACAISSAKGNLTRFHASIVVILTGSPLFFYLFLYSLISLKWRKHRMNGLVGDGQWFRRSVMLIAGLFWIAIFTYILLPDKFAHFSQASCVINSQISNYLYILPFVFVEVGYGLLPGAVLFAGIFVGLVIVGWFVGIWLQRKKIWSPGRGWTPRPGKVWAVTGREYPFIHLVSVVIIPNLYWIAVIETAVVFSGDRSSNLATYGQILSVFVAVPSLASTLLLYPKLVSWFFDLTWVRRVPYFRMVSARWRGGRGEAESSNSNSKRASSEDVNEYGLANVSISQVDLKEDLVVEVGR